MEMIFRAFDNIEFDDFGSCFNHEIKALGVVLLDDYFRVTDDYEKVYFIYLPKAKDAQILIDYADCGEFDASMWRFTKDIELFEPDEPVLFHWSEADQAYVADQYSSIEAIVKAVKDNKVGEDN